MSLEVYEVEIELNTQTCPDGRQAINAKLQKQFAQIYKKEIDTYL